MTKDRVVFIGGGPACLTSAYILSKENKFDVQVLEADPQYLGGISKTVNYKNFLFDIGGHRFFSKSERIEKLWDEILKDDMIVRDRSSRIFYNGNFYSYPLKAFEAFFKLGPIETALCIFSYVMSRIFPVKNPRNFEDWVSNQFGKRLFRIFFKTYTEKVWGMSCKDISADWAAQRIKGLSLWSAIKNALFPSFKPKSRTKSIKSLIETFRYPRKGPGMMWEEAGNKIRENGGEVHRGAFVYSIALNADKKWTVKYRLQNGEEREMTAANVVSSAPLGDLLQSVSPQPSQTCLQACRDLKYRDFLVVALIVREKNFFSDNWIYIHDPKVLVGRIQNFKSWSPEMVPDSSLNCYGLEYFCFEGDSQWTSKNEDLIELAKKELIYLGLATQEDILDGSVVRQPKAYPVYDDSYEANVNVIRKEFSQKYPGFHMVGRNGMHKYNNQDHAMMTGILTAENIMTGYEKHDVWLVNQDAEYHEEKATSGEFGLRSVPSRVGQGIALESEGSRSV